MSLVGTMKLKPIPSGAVMSKDEYDSLPTEVYQRCSIIFHSGLQFPVEGSVSEIYDRMGEKPLGFIRVVGAESLNDGKDLLVRVSEIAALAPLPEFERKVMVGA